MHHVGFRPLCNARDRLVDLAEPGQTVAYLAREAGISREHFIRRFEALFGVTPHQYRIDARLQAAKRMLATSSMSVTEVCMEVGFSSLGSFSDLFRRRVGESPSAYQRRVRPLVQVPGVLPLSLAPGCFTLMGCLPVNAFRDLSHFSRSIAVSGLRD